MPWFVIVTIALAAVGIVATIVWGCLLIRSFADEKWEDLDWWDW
jgi:hypothetical protein